jgi:hypothetical protein
MDSDNNISLTLSSPSRWLKVEGPKSNSISRRGVFIMFSVLVALAVLTLSHKSVAAQLDYGHGEIMEGAHIHTIGYNARSYNEVYFYTGTGAVWSLRYCNSDTSGVGDGVPTSCGSWYGGTVNPLVDNRTCSYCFAEAENGSDATGHKWTLLTTG